MSNFNKELSVIIPVFNEQGTLRELTQRLSASLKKAKFKFELIFIDDHSTDKTKQVVRSLKNPKIRYFEKKGKQGKSYSLFEGFNHAKYANIGFIDADLQYSPEDIVKLALKLDEADVVVADRKNYKDSFLRKSFSRMFRTGFGKLLFKLDADIQSGLKVFRKEVLEAAAFTPRSGWSFDLEFLRNARECGFVIASHPITFLKRKKGSSKVGILKTSLELGASALTLRTKGVSPKLIKPVNTRTMRGAGMRYKKSKYVTHSTLPYQKSAIQTFTLFQKVLLALLVVCVGVGLMLSPFETASLIITVLSFIYFSDTLFNLFIVTNSLRKSTEVTFSKKALDNLQDKDLPIYTILCPLYKEAHIIPQFVKNISAISWPKKKLDVLLLLEEDDKESIAKARAMKLPAFVRIIVVPNSQPKTKPKACNYGLSFAKGELLVIYDAEDKPDTLQLKKAYLAFKRGSKNVVCYQAKLNYYNPTQNLLTRFFTAEYSLWFGITLTGFQSINTTIPLGGTSNHFKTADIIRLHGWDPFNVTEDADLGMRLFKEGYKTAIIDSVTLEEANSRWGNWVRQRSRWIKGYMQTYLVHTRKSLSFVKEQKLHYLAFHLIVGGKIAFILINPFLWLATIAYFTLYAYVGPAIERLYTPAVFYMAASSLVFGNFLFLYYYMIGVMKKKQYGLVKYIFLIPFYWLMISYAGTVALYQLFFKPFYWEKTLHGLHLPQTKKAFAKTPAIKAREPIILPIPAVKPSPFFPAPTFSFPSAATIVLLPFIVIGNVARGIVETTAWLLVIIGTFERLVISSIVSVVNRFVIHPLKYAISILA